MIVFLGKQNFKNIGWQICYPIFLTPQLFYFKNLLKTIDNFEKYDIIKK